MKKLSTIFILLCIWLNVSSAQESPPQNLPPVATFTFAGPIVQGTSIRFKYSLAIHSIDVDRIQIIDAKTEQVLIDDAEPKLATGKLEISNAPTITLRQWDGFGKAEDVTDSSPAWLYEKSNTEVLLEARLYKSGNLVFARKRAVTLGYKWKQITLIEVGNNKQMAALMAFATNKQPARPKSSDTSGIHTIADAKLQADITRSVSNYEVASGGVAKVILVAAKSLGKEGQAFVEQWTFETGATTVDYRIELIQATGGGVDFGVSKLK